MGCFEVQEVTGREVLVVAQMVHCWVVGRGVADSCGLVGMYSNSYASCVECHVSSTDTEDISLLTEGSSFRPGSANP